MIFKQLQNDIIKSTSFKLRLWNELATVFLVAIVFLIVLKSNTGFIWGMLGLIIFSATLMLAVQIYKKSRDKKGENSRVVRTKKQDGSIEKKEDNKSE
jgi:putative membrane protein